MNNDERSGSRSLIILKKEFREIFRDRRTIISVVVSPLLITPALFAMMGLLIHGQTERAKTETYNIGVIGAEAAPKIVKALHDTPNIKIYETTADKAQQQIKDRRLSAAIVLPPNTEASLNQGRTLSVEILQDAGSQTSQSATARVSAAFNSIGQKMVAERLRQRNLPPEYAVPFKVTEKPIEAGGSAATFLLAMFLPYSLVISTFSGAIYAAFDQVAGEKERGTLETLLVSPASRRDIVLGKFGAVVGVCLASSLLTIVGLVFTFSSRAKAFSWLSQGGLHLSFAAIAATMIVLLPLAVLFAGLLLAVSTFARNQKEAQTYLAPLFLIVLMPAMSSMFINSDVSRTVALVPVLNASIIIKQALSGSYDAVFIALAFLASIFYAAIALTFATRLFQKESVLIKT